MKKLKIAMVIPSLADEAPNKIALSLADGLFKNGHHVELFYLSDSESKLTCEVQVRKISFSIKSFLLFSSFDIIHSHMLRPDIFVSCLYWFVSNKTKRITTLHNYFYDELYNYYNTFISLIFGTIWNLSWLNFDKLITLTSHSREYYVKYSFNKNVDYIFNGHDIDVCPSKIDSKKAILITNLKDKYNFTLGIYCNLIERKGIDIVLQYLSISNSGSLVVFGDGPDKDRLLSQVKSLNISERVVFMGRDRNAHQYNYLFDVFVMPSRSEGFGLSLIEAALHKTPIVCSDIPVFRELFTDSHVEFFSLDSVSSLDNAIQFALSSQKSGAARECSRNKYSLKVMTENYEREYYKILDGAI